MSILISCEHATNHVPKMYASLFKNAEAALASHRGWDPGSLKLGQRIAKAVSAPLFQTRVRRLLVEVNRSANHPQLFSSYSRTLEKTERQNVMAKFYFPYRKQIREQISAQIEQTGSLLHISIHTFTPQLDGSIRNADVGLLYDPSRSGEKTFCDAWRHEMLQQRPDLRVRRNYPYLGKADGFTTALRRQFDSGAYRGIELEVNQKWLENDQSWRLLSNSIAESLVTTLGST